MRSLEIFSGAGGLAKGLELAGFRHASFIEFNKNACESLRRNFDPALVYQGNIAQFNLENLENIELIAGGPPCQPFSLAGKHRAHDDHRDMFPQAIRCVAYYRPKAFIFENVKGLLRKSFAEYFEYIILRLTYPGCALTPGEDWQHHLARLRKTGVDENHKYNVSYRLLNAADYGVPQKRERVVIVGIRADLETPWQFPEATHSQDRLNWEKYVTGDYWKRHDIPPRHNVTISAKLQRQYGIFAPSQAAWLTIRDALATIPHPLENHNIVGHEFRTGARIYPGHTGSDIDEPAKTIKAGDHGVPGGENMIRYADGKVRYLTSYEAKLIQTFPHNFHIAGSWGEAMRQIGNAVPVLLSELLGQQLINLLQPPPCPTPLPENTNHSTVQP